MYVRVKPNTGVLWLCMVCRVTSPEYYTRYPWQTLTRLASVLVSQKQPVIEVVCVTMWPRGAVIVTLLVTECWMLEVEERHPYAYQYAVYDEGTESSYEVIQSLHIMKYP